MRLRAFGGSATSTISTPATVDGSGGGWGRENMSLKTGEARERTSLWARKSRMGGSRVLRMISPSGASKLSSFGIVVVERKNPGC